MKTVLLFTLVLGLYSGNTLQRTSEISVINISQITEINQIVFSDSRIRGLTFQPQSNNIATIVDHISGSPPMRYYDVIFLSSESLEVTVKTEDVLQATAMAFSPDGSLFAIGNSEGEISIHSTENYKLILSFPSVGLVVTDLAFSPNTILLGATFGNPVLSGEGEYAFQLWSLESGESIFSYPFGAGVYGGGVAFDGTGERILFSTTDASSTVENSAIQVWEAATNQVSITQYEPEAFSNELIFDVPSNTLFYISEESIYAVHPFTDSSDSNFQLGFEQESETIMDIALHPEEPIIAVGFFRRTPRPDGGPSATNAGIIRLYHTQTGEELMALDVPEGAITSLAFNSEGSLLASGGMDGTVRLWGVAVGE